MKFTWNSSLITGYDLIDREHKSLFEEGNRFFQAIAESGNKDTYIDSLNYLVQYTRAHFKHEEDLMRESNYAQINSHISRHNELIKHLASIYQKLIDFGVYEGLDDEVTEFIQSWFVDHIYKYDKALAFYLTSTCKKPD